MSAAADTVKRYLEAHAGVRGRLPGCGLDWLRNAREAALQQFAAAGFPTQREEAWKYTNVTPITRELFQPARGPVSTVGREQVDALALPGWVGPRLVFVDGFFAPAFSTLATLPEGVQVGSLGQALAAGAAGLETHLAGSLAETGGFLALNAAFMADGAYLQVPGGVEITEPVELLYLATAGEPAALVSPRNLILAGAGSRLTVVERYAALGDGPYLTNAVTEVVLAEGARLEHYALVEEGARGFHIARTRVRQSLGSRFSSYGVALGGALVRNELKVELEAEGSEAELGGLYVLGGRQHLDNAIHVDHLSPGGTSRQLFKGVLDDAARAVFSGRVIVHPQAQHSDATQVNKNLLLSREAEVDTRPQLEIYADDVKCSHGATVGQLDADALFYLRARGIDPDAARDLLIHAFVGDVVERIALEPLRRAVERTLSARLLHGRDLGALA
jgi:Fe-S cluster assembly protein SufD